MEADDARHMQCETGLPDGMVSFTVGKRNAWKRDSRRVRENARVTDEEKRRWAKQREQEHGDGQRMAQRRGLQAEDKRRERRSEARLRWELTAVRAATGLNDGSGSVSIEMDGASQGSAGGARDRQDMARPWMIRWCRQQLWQTWLMGCTIAFRKWRESIELSRYEEQREEERETQIEELRVARAELHMQTEQLKQDMQEARNRVVRQRLMQEAMGLAGAEAESRDAERYTEGTGYDWRLKVKRYRGYGRMVDIETVDLIGRKLEAEVMEYKDAFGDLVELKQWKNELDQRSQKLHESLEQTEELFWNKAMDRVKAELDAEVQYAQCKMTEAARKQEETRKNQVQLKQAQRDWKAEKQLKRLQGDADSIGDLRLAVMPQIGLRERSFLDRDVMSGGLEQVIRKQVGPGITLYNYRSQSVSVNISGGLADNTEDRKKLIQLRRECRGLVIGQDGFVIARPVQRFYKVFELQGLAEKVKAVTVTEKLDGEMMVGLVVSGAIELWSRGGWTEQARSATRYASSVKGIMELIDAVWSDGGSPTFEYIGRQSMVRVRYSDTELVLVAVRDRVSGEWWSYHRMEVLCEQHEVQLVRQYTEFIDETLANIDCLVKKWQGCEGVVAWIVGGQVYKIKTEWWRGRDNKSKRRWYTQEAKLAARERSQKRQQHMEREDQRVVIRGWSGKLHPSLVMKAYEKAVKVEAYYDRQSGKQGTVIVSFGSAEAARAVLGRRRIDGVRVMAERAYSARSTPSQECKVKTWWKSGRFHAG
jgi:hypothetical protein